MCVFNLGIVQYIHVMMYVKGVLFDRYTSQRFTVCISGLFLQAHMKVDL